MNNDSPMVAEVYIQNWVGKAHVCGEGNGTPLQYFCLENRTDGRAW